MPENISAVWRPNRASLPLTSGVDLGRLKQEATAHYYALPGGIVTSSEVVAWADAWIWRLDEVPDALVEVSLNGSRRNELFTALGELAGAETPVSLEAVATLFSLLEDHLLNHSAGFRGVTRLLQWLAIECALPRDLSAEAYNFDNVLSLADQGILGDPCDVQRDILAFLERHADRSTPPKCTKLLTSRGDWRNVGTTGKPRNLQGPHAWAGRWGRTSPRLEDQTWREGL